MPVLTDINWGTKTCYTLESFAHVRHEVPGLSNIPWIGLRFGLVMRLYPNAATVGTAGPIPDATTIITSPTPCKFGIYGTSTTSEQMYCGAGGKGNNASKLQLQNGYPTVTTLAIGAYPACGSISGGFRQQSALLSIGSDELIRPEHSGTGGDCVLTIPSTPTQASKGFGCVIASRSGYGGNSFPTNAATLWTMEIKRTLNTNTGRRYEISGGYKTISNTDDYTSNSFKTDMLSSTYIENTYDVYRQFLPTENEVNATMQNIATKDLLGWKGIEIVWPFHSYKIAVLGYGLLVTNQL